MGWVYPPTKWADLGTTTVDGFRNSGRSLVDIGKYLVIYKGFIHPGGWQWDFFHWIVPLLYLRTLSKSELQICRRQHPGEFHPYLDLAKGTIYPSVVDSFGKCDTFATLITLNRPHLPPKLETWVSYKWIPNFIVKTPRKRTGPLDPSGLSENLRFGRFAAAVFRKNMEAISGCKHYVNKKNNCHVEHSESCCFLSFWIFPDQFENDH